MRFNKQSTFAFDHRSRKTARGKQAGRRRKLQTSVVGLSPLSAPGWSDILLVLIFTFSMIFIPPPSSLAATPASGTIGPTGPTNTWVGPPTGGASANESTCVDGVNCDVYTLNVTGTTTDWATKLIFVKIAWTVPANDHDLYIHYDSNNNGVFDSTDPVVASGTNGGRAANGRERNR